MGPPGSGKSTQAELLADQLGVPHLQTGDLLYFLSQEDTHRGREIKKLMEAGDLVDDQLVLEAVEEHLKGEAYKKGFVLDGTPRSLWQAEHLKVRFDKVFYLDVSDEENIKRLVKRGRKDDTPEVIKKRLKAYHQDTEPMLSYYRKIGILEEVDGERPIKAILDEIMARLKGPGPLKK